MRDPPRIVWNCSGISPLLIYKVTPFLETHPKILASSLASFVFFTDLLKDFSRFSRFHVGDEELRIVLFGDFGVIQSDPTNHEKRMKMKMKMKKEKKEKHMKMKMSNKSKNKIHEEKEETSNTLTQNKHAIKTTHANSSIFFLSFWFLWWFFFILPCLGKVAFPTVILNCHDASHRLLPPGNHWKVIRSKQNEDASSYRTMFHWTRTTKRYI